MTFIIVRILKRGSIIQSKFVEEVKSAHKGIVRMIHLSLQPIHHRKRFCLYSGPTLNNAMTKSIVVSSERSVSYSKGRGLRITPSPTKDENQGRLLSAINISQEDAEALCIRQKVDRKSVQMKMCFVCGGWVDDADKVEALRKDAILSCLQ